MPYLPLNIDLQGINVLVVGAGSVATRKVVTLVNAGAIVRVIAPEVSPELVVLATAGNLSLKVGTFEAGDLKNMFLVVAATNDNKENLRIAAAARNKGLLTVAVSEPRAGNCIFPAVLRRGNLEIGVSTHGTCPGFSAIVRDVIADTIGEGYGEALNTLAKEREKLLTEGLASTYNNEILRSRARELLLALKCGDRVP